MSSGLAQNGYESLGYLTAGEIKEAEETLIRQVQRNTFPDEIKELKQGKQVSKSSSIVKLDPQLQREKDLLVVGGRLKFAQISEEAKHQVIIPHKNTVIEKLILHVHAKAIMLVQKQYWLFFVKDVGLPRDGEK
jgi:hypothetical protein